MVKEGANGELLVMINAFDGKVLMVSCSSSSNKVMIDAFDGVNDRCSERIQEKCAAARHSNGVHPQWGALRNSMTSKAQEYTTMCAHATYSFKQCYSA
eukprot:1151200-Pelagomonas_calceolata.AAC.3